MAAQESWKKTRKELFHPVASKDKRLTQAEVIWIMNEMAGKKAVIVHAAGGLPGDLHKMWESKSTGDYHHWPEEWATQSLAAARRWIL